MRRPRRRGGRSGPPETRDRRGPTEPAGQYGVLLALLIVTYLLSASGLSKVAGDLQALFFLGVMLLVLRTARVSRRIAFRVGVVALIGSVVAVVAASWPGARSPCRASTAP